MENEIQRLYNLLGNREGVLNEDRVVPYALKSHVVRPETDEVVAPSRGKFPWALAEKVKKLTNSQAEIVKIPYEQAYEPGFEDMFRRVPDLRKVKSLLNWRPQVGTDELLGKVIKYARDQPNHLEGIDDPSNPETAAAVPSTATALRSDKMVPIVSDSLHPGRFPSWHRRAYDSLALWRT